MSGTRAPSAYAVQQAMSALLQAKARLLAEAPDITEDERLLLDSIEGEAEGDPFAVLDRLVAAAIHAADMAEIAHVRATELAEREARFKRRNEQLRGVVFDMISALDIKRPIERPTYTASIGQGPVKVILTDEEALQDQYVRITKTPILSAIGNALKAGEQVNGATLSNPAPRLILKTR
jgi:hypothetical protein